MKDSTYFFHDAKTRQNCAKKEKIMLLSSPHISMKTMFPQYYMRLTLLHSNSRFYLTVVLMMVCLTGSSGDGGSDSHSITCFYHQ
jgi:hypothetical protein